ncbi:MAG: helix-turn-helix transcriptional regulator [Kiritimatiellia bacterium]
MHGSAHKTIHSERYERFRRMLVAERERAGFTQIQLAEALGRPQSFVSKYETGERRIDVEEFIQIAEALQADASGLIRALLQHPR